MGRSRYPRLAAAALIAAAAGCGGGTTAPSSNDTPAAPTTAGLLTSASLVYQGAFRLPYSAVDDTNNAFRTFAFGAQGLGFNAANNSLFITNANNRIAEISIPRPSLATDPDLLPQAAVMQGLSNAFESLWSKVDGDTGNGVGLGSVFPLASGKLVAPAFTFYDSTGAQTKAFLVRDTHTFGGTSHTTGPFTMDGPPVGPQTNGRGQVEYVDGYVAAVPPDWQTALGGPQVVGNASLSIISRTSAGPALFSTDLSRLGVDARPTAQPLVYYPYANPLITDHPLLDSNQAVPGGCSRAENDVSHTNTTTVFNCASSIKGVVIPTIGRSALFFGRLGKGPGCYGQGTGEEARQWTLVDPKNSPIEYCYDPKGGYEGNHAYPYVYYVWAYDLNDLAAVRAGSKMPWAIRPYATWALSSPFSVPPFVAESLSSAAYDPATQTIYLVQHDADWQNFDGFPLVLAYKVVTPAITPAAPTGLTAIAVETTQVALNWTASAGATSYAVKRLAGRRGDGVVIATGVTGTSFVDRTVAGGQTYTYAVSASNGSAESSSASVDATIPGWSTMRR